MSKLPHGWGNQFDYDAYLDDLVSNNFNYIRLWLYETAKVAYPGGENMVTRCFYLVRTSNQR